MMSFNQPELVNTDSIAFQESWFGRVMSSFVIFVLLAHIFIPSIATAAECIKTGTACIEGKSTKIIDGVAVTKDCWQYQDTYQCSTIVQGQKACDPLSAKSGCGQTYSNCLEKDINGVCLKFTRDYTCETDLKKDYSGTLPVGITELPPTHEITTSWDTSACDKLTSTLKGCNTPITTCTSGQATKIINGIAVSQPCWQQTNEYTCLSTSQNSKCEASPDSNCTKVATTCINTVDGVCQASEDKYKCLVRPGSTSQSDTCKDKDFSRVMTGLEGAREFARYYDEGSMSFFKGLAADCSIKLDGALGGNCCKTAESADKWTDAAISTGVNYALGQLASSYTYEILVTQGSQFLASVASSASAIGLGTTVAPSTATAGVGASIIEGKLTLAINPAMLGISIAMVLLQMWLACEPEEQKTALRKKAGLCHDLGSYCSQKVLGVCVEEKRSYCCFVSKLARIINEGGREQIGKSWGTAKAPQCGGFTKDEIAKIDFSKLDLTEFMADIKFKALDSNAATQNIKQTSSMKASSGNYYGQ